MRTRLELQQAFEDILGTRNVYFEPPATIRMNYPAIVYERSKIRSDYAGNRRYKTERVYDAVLIGRDPDSAFLEPLLELPYCSYDRHYVQDNLHHDAFTIYL
ncbi:MAG: hypothetical protein J6S78_02110 [Lachnospiraceae bacterium]|nr:hypothetical protein [Lachnospiraceae bacterium]